MKYKLVALVLSVVVATSLAFAGCAPKAAPPEEGVTPPKEEKVPPAVLN